MEYPNQNSYKLMNQTHFHHLQKYQLLHSQMIVD